MAWPYKVQIYWSSLSFVAPIFHFLLKQYTCAQQDEAGPPGCLQYYTATTGLFKNFGYPSSNTASTTADSTTHLQNQNYDICIRRASGKPILQHCVVQI